MNHKLVDLKGQMINLCQTYAFVIYRGFLKLFICINRVLQKFQHCFSIVAERSGSTNLLVHSKLTNTKNFKLKAHNVAYPPLRSGWFWLIFSLNSTATAGSSKPSTRSVNTLLPLPSPEALADASLFKILTWKLKIKYMKMEQTTAMKENEIHSHIFIGYRVGCQLNVGQENTWQQLYVKSLPWGMPHHQANDFLWELHDH